MIRPAFSLIELLVVLAILAILLSVAPVVSRFAGAGSEQDSSAATRRTAIRTGHAISAYADSLGHFTAWPDGSVSSDSAPQWSVEQR